MSLPDACAIGGETRRALIGTRARWRVPEPPTRNDTRPEMPNMAATLTRWRGVSPTDVVGAISRVRTPRCWSRVRILASGSGGRRTTRGSGSRGCCRAMPVWPAISSMFSPSGCSGAFDGGPVPSGERVRPGPRPGEPVGSPEAGESGVAVSSSSRAQSVGETSTGPNRVRATTSSPQDLARRPANKVRGPKAAWALASFVQTVGPIAHFAVGRR